METRFQTTSFIPKTSLDNVVSEDGQLQRRGGNSTTGNLVLLLCFFLFVCSLVSAGVVFFLGKLTETTKVEVQKNLTKYQQRNSTETIVEIKNLQDRISLIENIIKNHIAVSPLFDKLAENTLSRVAFTNFDLKKKNDGSFALSLKAQGIGYESIVAQDTQFSSPLAQRTFKNTLISDFSKPKDQDLATFTLVTTIPPAVARFTTYINGPVTDAVPVTSTTPTPTPAPTPTNPSPTPVATTTNR